MQNKSRYNISYKVAASVLIISHLVTFGPIRDAFAFSAQSASYKLSSGALNEGGSGRNATSSKLWQDAVGEPCTGGAQSTSYSLNSGFIPTIQSNPPVLTQDIPYQGWAINTSKANAFDLDDYFSSPDGYLLTFSVTGNSSINVTINPTTHVVSFAQPQDWSGVEKIYFTATDTEGSSIQSNEVVLQVANVIGQPNKPVVVDTQITLLPTKEGDLVTLTIKAYDLDNNDLTFTYSDFFTETRHWKEGNFWYSEATWQTGAHSTGHYTTRITVSDGALTDIEPVMVNIGNFNHPPLLDPLANIVANEGGLVTITPHATDVDNDPIVYYYSAPFDSQGKWLTGYSDAGTHTSTVTASDGIDTVSQSVTIIVANTNRPPQVTLTLTKYTVKPNEVFRITISASDPDGDSMTFSLKKDGVEITSGSIASTYDTSSSFSVLGDHTISATVTDSDGRSTTDTKGVDVADTNTNRDSINPVMGDFNGDGLTDLGLHNSDTGTWEICISNAGVFNNAVDWLTGFGNSRDWWPIGGDFNGDGKSDVGVYNISTGELKIAFSSGSGFSVAGTWLTFTGASYSWQPFTGNFNGDKYTDFALYNKDTGEVKVALGTGSGFGAFNTWITNFGNGYVAMGGDFNGDSLTDLCLFNKSTGEFKVAFSNTQVFVDGSTWISGFAINQDALISDFNHDGLTDIGWWDKIGGTWHYAISTGANFLDKGIWLNNFGTSQYESATTGDFNGDGVTDPACFDRDQLGINRWMTHISTDKIPDLLTEIDNGIGGKTQVSYTYTAASNNPLLPFPVYVASSISLVNTFPADRAATYTQNFSFSGGYYDAAEREFRGFYKVRATDPITNNYSETYFYQGKPDQDGALKGQIEKILSYDGNGLQISQTLNTYEVRKAGPETNVLGFPMLVEQDTTVWEESATSLGTKDKFTYDNIGNLIEQRDEGDISKTGDDKSTDTTYAQAYEVGFNRPLQTALKDKDGNIVTQKNFEYDVKGNLTKDKVSIFNPLTSESQFATTEYAYDSFGNLTLTTNALNKTVTTDYETDFYAYPQTVTNSLDQVIHYTYEPKFGAVKSVTDTNGYTSTTNYDSLGRVIEVKNADNQINASYSYPDFNTKITTNALGLSGTEYIDGLGRKYKTISSGEDGTSARQVSSEAFYNNRGQTDSESIAHYIDENPNQISYIRYEYDIRGRVKRTISDFPGTSKDAEASINYINPLYIETTDPQGHRKGTQKDVYGNVLEVIEFTQGGTYHTHYEYDIQNNLTKTTDNLNNIIQIFYDSIGRKLKMIDPDMGTWLYEYDLAGNLKKQTDAMTQVLEFEYDELNRLTRKFSGTQTLATYIYDETSKANCIGRLSKVTDTSGSTEFFYDKFGRETKSIKTVEGVAYTVDRTYDILNRLATLKYPDGEVLNYAYDTNSGSLEKVQGAQTYVQDITYNAKGQMKVVQYGNSTQTQYTYGQDLRLSRILTQGQTTLQDLNYDFDKNGNLTTLTDNIRSNIRTYGYDDLDRLTQASNVPVPGGGYGSLSYQYDSIGNMTYKSDVGVMTYGSGAGPHALTSAGGYNYQYDANGNMTVGKNKTLAYDVENRLNSVNQQGTITSFVYDGDGGRVKKTTGSSSTIYIGSLYEVDSSGTIRKHIFAGANRVATRESTGNTYYYHSDHLGSSNVITNQSGAQAQYCEYTPYGTLARNVGTDAVSHKFTGKELDVTGLYFYGARYYDPEIGRFISADTIIQAPYDPQSFNRYSYCRNNPINYIDPTGHNWFSKWWGKIVGAILGIVATIFTGNMMVGFQVFNFFSSLQNTTSTGNWGAFAGGLVGGLIGGYVGGAFAENVAGILGADAFTFGGGFLIGATEMGIAGFGGAFGSALGGGANFSDAMKAGGIGFGIGAVVGGIIEGSYLGGMQNMAHGMSREKAYQSGIKRLHALSVNKSDKTTGIVGSRPLGSPDDPGPFRHRYIRGQVGRFEMGPDERTGLIELNGEGSFSRTEQYIKDFPSQLFEQTVVVSQSGFNSAVSLYKAAWVGTPYAFYNCNSNFAVNSVIYGAGANAPENLGLSPIGIDHY